MNEEVKGGMEPAGEEQAGGTPQEMMQDAMEGIQSQIQAINQFAQSIGQAGQGQAAKLLQEGAMKLQEGLAALGATPGEQQPANEGVDVNSGGRNVQPA